MEWSDDFIRFSRWNGDCNNIGVATCVYLVGGVSLRGSDFMKKMMFGIGCGLMFVSSWMFGQTPTGPSAVTMDNLITKLKIKGRVALGFNKGETDATFQAGSFDVPDMKVWFTFSPDEQNELTARFNLNNAAANTPLLDYAFFQSKDFIPYLKGTPFSLSGKLGRMKLGVGEETFSDNPVEGPLTSNSAAAVGGSDEGAELSTKVGSFSVSNGARGVVSDNGMAKAWMSKLFYAPLNYLDLSGHYYHSGSLKGQSSEVSIAGIIAPPSGALNWKRQVWGVDLRYDFVRGTKPLNPPSASDSKAIMRLSYGQFADMVTNASHRSGQFGFMDGLYNWTSKIFSSARVSFIGLNGHQIQSLNSVSANHYERYSLGVGYRWFENTHLRFGYDHNVNGGDGISDANDDLVSAYVTIHL